MGNVAFSHCCWNEGWEKIFGDFGDRIGEMEQERMSIILFFFFLIKKDLFLGELFFSWPREGCGILVSRPGVKCPPLAKEAWNLNPWTARAVLAWESA